MKTNRLCCTRSCPYISHPEKRLTLKRLTKLLKVNWMTILDDVKTRFGVAAIGAIAILAAVLGLISLI